MPEIVYDRCQRPTELFEGGVLCQIGFKPAFSALLILLGYALIALRRQSSDCNAESNASRLHLTDARLRTRLCQGCPDTIETPMVTGVIAKGELDMTEAVASQPIARLGRADEIAASVLWRCSLGASLIVGVT